MKRLFPFVLACAVLLTACASSADEPVSSPPDTGVSNSADAPLQTPLNPYAPNPDYAAYARGEAFLNSTDLLTLESFPLQFTLHLTGDLPTPCHILQISVAVPDANNKVLVEVYSVADPNQICAQMTVPFDVNMPLGSFATGTYTLWVNGQQVAEFQG